MSQRWKHWEFWPTWAAYPPVVAWIVYQALRHGGVGPITAANPGIEHGGLVGESKHALQSKLPAAWAVPSALIATGDAHPRVSALTAIIDRHGWTYPLIVKPDVGQRGVGVRKVTNPEAALQYFERCSYPTVVQPWHPGPFECGLFYARSPSEPRGRIISITEKQFPCVEGNGHSTLAELIDAHPRYRRQSSTFRRRHASSLGETPKSGTQVQLGEVGNHSQGALFLDGRRLWSAALEARIDAIAQSVPGFFIGRFDVRYASTERFMAGEDLAIIELNGVAAEPTDIYDPDRSVASAYAALFDQWRRVFEIGAANMRRGHRGASGWQLLRLALAHLTDARVFPVSS
ncbi:MAG TPA: hypothetical protein VF491_01485 [Vicinamibacterales bacterium]